jgi:hypothetical protein
MKSILIERWFEARLEVDIIIKLRGFETFEMPEMFEVIHIEMGFITA